jgi:uncharacterized protein involved in copper resistance
VLPDGCRATSIRRSDTPRSTAWAAAGVTGLVTALVFEHAIAGSKVTATATNVGLRYLMSGTARTILTPHVPIQNAVLSREPSLIAGPP